MKPSGGSGSRASDDALESSKAPKRALGPDQHVQPTIPAPTGTLPSAASKRSEPTGFAEEELPTSALPRPPRMPSGHELPRGHSTAPAYQTMPVGGRTGSIRARTDRPSVRARMGRLGEPTVLLIGAPESLSAALEPALARHRVNVEQCAADKATDAVVVMAPDLVVLAGEAASDSGHHILRALAASPQSSVVPVALLDDNTELETRLRAFRHGAAAVIPRSASMDEMAERIATLAREIPERDAELLGDVGEATLHELVGALEKELRTGILSVKVGSGGEDEAVRIVLGGGRALSETIDDFVQRVREHVVAAEPLRYEFDERAGGTVQLLTGSGTAQTEERAEVKGLRVVLADDDAARADAVAQELRDRGVDVVVTDLAPSDVRFQRLRQMDPAILLIGDQQAQGPGFELMRRMRRDTRLRWASLLVLRWNELWTEQSPVPAIERIIGTLSALAEPERALKERAGGNAFDTRLEITGPARMLRALCAAAQPIRVTVQSPRVRVRLDLSEGIIVGAMGETNERAPRELGGPTALAAMLVISNGRVHVEPTEQPATTNLMSPPDVAFNMAEAEPPPIAPSLPIPPPVPSAPPPAPEEELFEKPRRKGGVLGTLFYAFTGLFIVLLLGGGALYLARERGLLSSPSANPSVKTEPVASTPASAHPSASVAVAALPSASTAPSAVTSASAAPIASSAKAAPSSSAAAAAEAPSEDDNALTKAPTCETMLGSIRKNPGVYPGAAWDEVRKARKQMVRGDLDAAEGGFCMAVRFDGKNADAVAGLARLFMARRDPEAAVKWARQAVMLDPDDHTRQILLGDALALGGEPGKAIEPLLLGFGLSTTDADGRRRVVGAQLKLGDDSIKRQDQSAAERAYRRAMVLDPTNAWAAAGIARTLLDQGHPKAAAHWARRAATLDPKLAFAQIVLGDALSKLGDKSGAGVAWKKAVELDPNDPAARARAVTND